MSGSADPLRGELRVPGDKSVSHRALILSALARGRSLVVGANTGADVRSTASALAALGAHVRLYDKGIVEVEGRGVAGLVEPGNVLDAGNSGTTLRMMLGVCAGVDGHAVLTGDESLRSRPMLRVVSPLRSMGARIDGRHAADRAPLAVRGGRLTGEDLVTPVASAQVKSALLLAGLAAEGTTSVTEPAPSRDHTERMLTAAGVPVLRSGTKVSVAGGCAPHPREWRVPGDISSAMFLICAALVVEGSDLIVRDVGLNPTRTAALEVLRQMGAELDVAATGEWGGEPVGDVRAVASRLEGVEVDPALVPAMIDEIPVLAVVATAAEGATVVRGAAELRVKESDRIATMVAALGALGADAEEFPDGLAVRGPADLHEGEVDSRGDHRVAMALAVAGLRAQGRVSVRGWASVATSFPEFGELLAAAQGRR